MNTIYLQDILRNIDVPIETVSNEMGITLKEMCSMMDNDIGLSDELVGKFYRFYGCKIFCTKTHET